MGKITKVNQKVNNPGMVKNTTDVMEQNSNQGEAYSWADEIRKAVAGAGKGEMRGGDTINMGGVNKGTGRGK